MKTVRDFIEQLQSMPQTAEIMLEHGMTGSVIDVELYHPQYDETVDWVLVRDARYDSE